MATAQKESVLERNKEIGTWIKNYRKAAGLTQTELSEKVGINEILLRNLERGKISRWFEKEGSAKDFDVFLKNVKQVTIKEIQNKRKERRNVI